MSWNCGHMPPVALGRHAVARERARRIELRAFLVAFLLGLAALWAASCTAPIGGEPQPAAASAQVALRALLPTPAALPDTARIGPLRDAKPCRDAQGATLPTTLTDPDSLPRQGGGYLLAIHAYVGGRNQIVVCESAQGDDLGPRTVALAAKAGKWNDQEETPNWVFTGAGSAVVLACSTYPNAEGMTEGRYKAISLAVASNWRGPYTWVHNGPVIGPVYSWATPYAKFTKVNGVTVEEIDGGMDEPALLVLAGNLVALVSGTSYAGGQTPCVGLAYTLPGPNMGRQWTVEPDPIMQAQAPSWIAQADVVQDVRDRSFHAFVTRSYPQAAGGGEGIHHLWSTDLRSWVEPDAAPIVRTTAGTSRAGRCFGCCALLERSTTSTSGWQFRLHWSERPVAQGTGPWTLATGVVDG